MMLLQLYAEFFRVGLFSVGGGLATLPFLSELGERSGWFTAGELANMLAVAESTPGPIGINMATYVGFTSAGWLGGAVATLGIVSPAILVILLISRVLERFRSSPVVEGAFYGLRAASVALITGSMLEVARIAFAGAGGGLTGLLNWPSVGVAAAVFALMRWKPTRGLHPICFVVLSAVAGIVLQL
jgi:chromate transporter